MLEYGTIKTALAFLKENGYYRVGDIRLGIDEEGDFLVTGWSSCFHLKSITRSNALEELQEIKSLFYKMHAESSELSDFIKGRKIKYSLAYDMGKSGIGVCSEQDDIVSWQLDLK